MRRVVSSGARALSAACLLAAAPAVAGPADVRAAQVRCDAGRVCSFEVTVEHADAGWDHYADRWEVLTPDGVVIATRVLRHPHTDEQPFTRGLAGVHVPEGVDRVRIRAHDSVHGDGGAEVEVALDVPAPAPAP